MKIDQVIDKLPDLPSDLILVALRDLEAVEKLPDRYEVDMGQWHTGAYNDEHELKIPCGVCFAGAVLAQTLQLDDIEDAKPKDFESKLQYKLYALNDLRCGYVSDALQGLQHVGVVSQDVSINEISESHDRVVVSYNYDPDEFKKQMRQIAADLKEVGL